ncbi:dihydropteroate synthase [Virgibacillus dakarensis]|uniref:Dihydropteroate synthase n=1 Tax=Lentibacillus populi TaxID=1827502 RepID=A0A9W5TZY2_9BACI|nr:MULTISPECIES: dihydropteroate synthase [Bacillaceae]MBT2218175.1 dihydropteroate synthase [Virgibacillus dakarensis]MTW86539.1 dihydropteroate synthase [Virgibacillus dakarensis]GGB51299.1 dihydropteroate synthase [Lentibacillus populi]
MLLKTRTKTYNLADGTHIMGILNVTPDSFSDGGSYTSVERAVKQAVLMEQQGADMIDIGGESTRPNHEPVSLEDELNRVLPVIRAVKKEIRVPISIDTYKAETARQAVEAGADIINDIWGAKKDPEIAVVAAEYHVPIILMHNRSNMNYTSLIDDMKQDLQESMEIAINAGVPEENIILDPGIGFAKTAADNLVVMNNLERFAELGYPVLLGTSRKRFIGGVLDLPAAERDIGTGATTCLGITKGVHIVRVHNVKINVELARMMDAMLGKGVAVNG